MRIIFIVFVLFTPLSVHAFSPSNAKDWIGLGTGLSHAQKFISNPLCYSSKEYFESCQYGLRKTAKELNLHIDLSHEKPNFDQILKTIVSKLPAEFVYGALVSNQLTYFDPHARLDNGMIESQKFGAGIRIRPTHAGLIVTEVMPGSSADQNGIQLFDRITKINGNPTTIKRTFSGWLLGQKNNPTELTIWRQGHEFTATVNNHELNDGSVTTRAIEVGGRQWTYIAIESFNGEACESVAELFDHRPLASAGVILDLRDNPGGFTADVSCVGQIFLGNKPLYGYVESNKVFPEKMNLEQKRSFKPDPITQFGSPDSWTVPLVAIINAGTASSAEILAQGLRDYRRAWLVGETSYGKGSMQLINSFRKKGSRLKLTQTIGFYTSPLGYSPQLNGIRPNFQVPFRRGASPEEMTVKRVGEQFEREPPAPPAPVWEETRGQQVREIESCVAKHFTPSLGDTQLEFAAMVLGCTAY